MDSLAGMRVVVTGGSRGLGLGIVEALVQRHALLTVVARNTASLAELERRLGVVTIAGDVTDAGLADQVLTSVQPDVLVLNAGLIVPMAPLDEYSWESFSAAWEHDVKAGFYWIQAALRHLSRGRVLVMSSGAAVHGSPLSGGYAGAKRMLWLMAEYANARAAEADRDLRFQTIVPMQVIGATALGDVVASAYARRKGITAQAFLAGFGAPLTPRELGEHVATVLADPCYQTARVVSIKGDTGLSLLA